MTALVVHDLLCGDLILGEVHLAGAKTGHHYWSRLPDGTDVDVTADQFRPDGLFGEESTLSTRHDELWSRIVAELAGLGATIQRGTDLV